jgi:hypothetical protein
MSVITAAAGCCPSGSFGIGEHLIWMSAMSKGIYRLGKDSSKGREVGKTN